LSPSHKRITKKQLKDDKFVDVMLEYGEKVRTHQRAVAAGVIILLLAVILGSWLVKYSRSSRSGSNQDFSQALKTLSLAATTPKDSKGYTEALAAFTQIRDEYGRRKEGKWAIYFIAYCQENLLDYLEAEKTYQTYLDKDPSGEYEIAAKLGIASCNAAVGRVKQQADLLCELAASDKVTAAQARDWRYQAAQIYMDAGYFQPAQALLEELKPDAEDAMQRRIEQDLAALKARQS
jgi:hypothetical protein